MKPGVLIGAVLNPGLLAPSGVIDRPSFVDPALEIGPAIDESPGLVIGSAIEGGPASEEGPGLDAGSALDTIPAMDEGPGFDVTRELDKMGAAVDVSSPLLDRAVSVAATALESTISEGPRSTDEEAPALAETVETMVGIYEASLAASEPNAWLSIAVMASLRKHVPEV